MIPRIKFEKAAIDIEFPPMVVESRYLSAAASTPIHTAADQHAKRIAVAVRYAFAKGRAAVNRTTLAQASTARQVAAALALAPKAVYKALLTTLPSVLRAALVAGGEVGAAGLGKRQPRAAELMTLAGFAFNAHHKSLDTWVASRVAELASQLVDTTKKNIATAVARNFDANGLRTMASWVDDLLESIGSVERAQRIADFESHKATNSGVLESFKQARDDGYLTGKEKKEWVAKDSPCDVCDELDGERVFIDEEFSSGDDAPPNHVGCKCELSTDI